MTVVLSTKFNAIPKMLTCVSQIFGIERNINPDSDSVFEEELQTSLFGAAVDERDAPGHLLETRRKEGTFR